MRAFPIVQRELTVAWRNPVILATRARVTRWGVGLAIVGLLMDWAGWPVIRWFGPILLGFIALLMTERALSQGFELIVEERRSGTFDLLRLAGVGPVEFTAGKAAGAMWLVGMQAMGLVPLLALPFLSGGLSGETFLGMVAFLPGVLLASVGVSLLGSALAREAGSALAWTWFLVLAWTLGPLVVQTLGRITLGRSPLPDEWMALSPVHVAMLLPSGLTRATSRVFWMGWLLMVGVGTACLAGAGLCLTWWWRREREETRPIRAGTRRHPGDEGGWLERPLEEVLAGETWRLRVPALALGGLALAWLLAAVAWGRPWLASVLCLAFLLLLALSSSLLDTVLLTLRVARDRREGAFEELLTSPLTEEQVVEGYVGGTHRLTRRLRWWMAGLGLVIWLAAIPFRSWTPGAFLNYALLGGAMIAWTAAPGRSGAYGTFRLAFFTGRVGASFLRGGGGVLMGNLYNLVNLWRLIRLAASSSGLPVFPTGSPLELCLVLLGLPVIVFLVAHFHREARSGAAANLARAELRRLAQEPLPAPGDPRLKGWKADEPVPTGETALTPAAEGRMARMGRALGRLNPFHRVTRPGRSPRR